MKRITIEIDLKPRSIRFEVPGSRIFKQRGFDLNYSFDIHPSERGLLSMGLGLLSPIIARHYSGEVEIALPADIPSSDADAWRLYHKIPSRIQIRSTNAKPDIACSPTDTAPPDAPIGLLYGGGKDSVAALALAEELYPSNPRHLLRLHWNAKSPERHRHAFEQGVLPSMSKLTEFDYLWVSSTMHAEVVDKADAASIHLARYLCSFIPYVESENPRYLCHGYDALEFHGSAYRRAHPQVLRHVDRIYGALGANTKIRSLCFSLPPKMTFGVVARLRPSWVSGIYMCESLDHRWCYRCRKCFTFGLLSLIYAVRTSDFDVQRMFDPQNPYVAGIADALQAPEASHADRLANLVAYPAHLQATGGWGEEVVRGAELFGLAPESVNLLRDTFARLSSSLVPGTNSVWLNAAAYEGGASFANQIQELARRHGLEQLASSPLEGHVKGQKVDYLMAHIE